MDDTGDNGQDEEALLVATACSKPPTDRARIKWMFTTQRARIKLLRAYPDPAKES